MTECWQTKPVAKHRNAAPVAITIGGAYKEWTMNRIDQTLTVDNCSGQESPTLCLHGLLDLIVALEPEWASLPSPLPLFLQESEQGLAETLGASDG